MLDELDYSPFLTFFLCLIVLIFGDTMFIASWLGYLDPFVASGSFTILHGLILGFWVVFHICCLIYLPKCIREFIQLLSTHNGWFWAV